MFLFLLEMIRDVQRCGEALAIVRLTFVRPSIVRRSSSNKAHKKRTSNRKLAVKSKIRLAKKEKTMYNKSAGNRQKIELFEANAVLIY